LTNLIQTIMQLPLSEIVIGFGASVNAGALVGLLVLRAEVKALRKQLEKIEAYILSNSKLK